MRTIIALLALTTICACFTILQASSIQIQPLAKEYQEMESFKNDMVQPFSEVLGQELAAMAMTAYCAPHHIEKWKCGTACKEYPGMQDIIILKNGFIADNHAFIGYQPKLNAIIISFKGTISIRNWMEDFDLFPVKYPYCEGCEVHQGFFDGYDGIQDNFWAGYQTLREKYPNATLMLTGHSLGAALSTMCAADMVNHGITDFIWYNYGSPRVGNEKFAQWLFGSIKQRLYRVTHHKDIITHLPLEDHNYHHLPQEVWYVKSSEPKKEHKLCNLSGEDPECSDKYALDLDINDHLYYMGYNFVYHISLCLL